MLAAGSRLSFVDILRDPDIRPAIARQMPTRGGW